MRRDRQGNLQLTSLARLGRSEGPPDVESTCYVNPPLVRASTVLAPSLKEWRRRSGLIASDKPLANYGRFGTTTTRAFEDAMAELEGAYRALSFPSGLAACTNTLMAFVKPGSHVLMTQSVYWPMRDFVKGTLARMGCDVEFYEDLDASSLSKKFRPNTVAVYLEAPGSLSFEVAEIDVIAKKCREAGIVTIMDNTWATPLLFRPLEHGVDVSIHSATKYITGHSDCILGVVSCTQSMWPIVSSSAAQFGQTASPDDTYQALRGLRTLGIRLRQHQSSAATVMAWLKRQPEVEAIYSPTLPGHPGHANWKRLFSGASGLFSFAIQTTNEAELEAFFDALSIFGIGLSWGGYESLVVPVEPRTRFSRTALESGCSLIRMHVGLEDPDDLIRDLQTAFEAMRECSDHTLAVACL